MFYIQVIGEILFDIFNEQKKLGGAPFNFFYHLLKLQNNVDFISAIGKDKFGRDLLKYLDENKFPINNIQINNKPTGTVNISLNQAGIPKYEITKKVAYDFINEVTIQQIPDLFYFGSLIQRNEVSKNTVRLLLEKNEKAIYKFCDINLRKDCYSEEIIRYSLEQSNILKINEEELDEISNIINLTGFNDNLIKNLAKEYDIPVICVTLGSKGSKLLFDNQIYSQPSKSIKLLDTIGAGDAFSAVLAYGILNNWSPQNILKKATFFAEHICQNQGAIPNNDQIYKLIRGKLN